MIIRSLFYIITPALLFLIISALPTFAADNCQPIYGGGQACQTQNSIGFIKEVLNPAGNQFSSNLQPNSHVFSRGENIVFRFTLTNNSANSLSNLQINDTLPINLDYVSADNATYNASTRLVTIKIASLKTKETKNYKLTARVNSQNLPSNMTPACMTNQAILKSTSFLIFNINQAQNTAIFCISANTVSATTKSEAIPNTQGSIMNNSLPNQTKSQTPIYPAPKTSITPSTGPQPFMLCTLLIFFLLGSFVRNKAKSVKID